MSNKRYYIYDNDPVADLSKVSNYQLLRLYEAFLENPDIWVFNEEDITNELKKRKLEIKSNKNVDNSATIEQDKLNDSTEVIKLNRQICVYDPGLPIEDWYFLDSDESYSYVNKDDLYKIEDIDKYNLKACDQTETNAHNKDVTNRIKNAKPCCYDNKLKGYVVCNNQIKDGESVYINNNYKSEGEKL